MNWPRRLWLWLINRFDGIDDTPASKRQVFAFGFLSLGLVAVGFSAGLLLDSWRAGVEREKTRELVQTALLNACGVDIIDRRNIREFVASAAPASRAEISRRFPAYDCEIFSRTGKIVPVDDEHVPPAKPGDPGVPIPRSSIEDPPQSTTETVTNTVTIRPPSNTVIDTRTETTTETVTGPTSTETVEAPTNTVTDWRVVTVAPAPRTVTETRTVTAPPETRTVTVTETVTVQPPPTIIDPPVEPLPNPTP